MSVRILGIWMMATAPVAAMALGAAGCGDDGGGGGGGTLGETVVATQNDFGDAACGCFDSLATEFESRGNCIDTLVLGTDEEMCIATAVDEIVGVQPTRECVIDAQETFIRCIEDGGCDGAAACESTYLSSVNDDCPRPSAAAQENFSDSVNECLGIDPNAPDGICPQQNVSPGFGQSVSGNTSGFGDDFSAAPIGDCPAAGAGARDVTFLYTPPESVRGGVVTIGFAEGTDFDAVLYGFFMDQGCPSTPEITDDGGVFCIRAGGAGVNLNVPDMPAPILMVVDGATEADAGNFVVGFADGG